MVKKSEGQKFEIMDHELVPYHEIISEDKKQKLFEKYDLTPDQLPKILNTDPVCISIDAQPGQVVKITRKSHTAKEAVAYRLVVEGN